MQFHPLPELLMLNKQNPGDFSGFRHSDDLHAALTANSSLALPFMPNESDAPRLGRREANQKAVPWGCTRVVAPTGCALGTPTLGGRSGLCLGTGRHFQFGTIP